MQDLEKIRFLRLKAIELQLEHVDVLFKYTDEELAGIYNGIGPASFPGWLRVVIDKLNPTLEPVALIHDVEWHETDRTEKTWHETNDRFRRNGLAAAKAAYGWYNPLRYRVMQQAVLFRMACNTHTGWKAWLDGAGKAT